MKNKLIRSLVITVVVGIILSVSIVIVVGLKDGKQATSLIHWNHWLIILSLTIIHIILRFIRWQYYLILLKHKIALTPSFACYLSGLALTMTPGKVGETLRSVYLKPYGIGYTDSVSAFFVERYTDVLAVIALSTLILAHYSGYQSVVVIICIVVFAILLIIRGSWFLSVLEHLQRKITGNRIKTIAIKLSNVLKSSSTLLSLLPLFIGFIIALMAWSIQVVAFYLILSYINQSVSLSFAIGCYSLAILAGAVSFLPGGIGGTEAVMILLLLSIGITSSDATIATLVTRIATLWFAVAIGLTAFVYVELSRRNNI